MKPTKRYRRISPLEWVYLSVSPKFQPCAIQLWIETEIIPSRVELEGALKLAAEVNPGARLVPRGGWWFDSRNTPRIRSISESEKASLSHFLFHEAFSFEEFPPLEIVCWEGAGLLFRCSHALMDAGGLIFFAEETFRALRGEPLLGSTTKISDHDYLQSLGHSARTTHPFPNKKSPLGPPTSTQSKFVWERRTIPGQVSAVSARLASSLTQMTQKGQPSEPSRVMVPVNLRYLDSTLRSTCNFSNPLFFEVPAASRWTEFYGRILDAFAHHDERSISNLDSIFPWIPISILSPIIHWFHERQVRTDRYLFSGIVSHVGSVSLHAFSTKDFTPKSIFLLPFDAPGSAVTLITMQHEKGLEIAASCPAATGGEGRLGLALDWIISKLECGRYSSPDARHLHSHYKPVAGARVDFPASLSVFSLFAEQVETSGERIAITEEGRSFSYAELDRLSLACAFQLQKRGVKSGEKVAILSDKSSGAVVTLLGILRLGAIFVPLDPEWPQERIRFVLKDCQPRCIVIEDRHIKVTDFSPRLLFSEFTNFDIVDSWSTESVFCSESAAYVLYTSGSTGRPKGVVVGQKSLLNYLVWAKDAYLVGLDVPVVFPFFTSLAFDLTLTSIFLPLVTGGEIRVFSQDDHLVAIRSILADPAVNAVKLTPSHLWLFLGVGVGTSGLRKFIVGGEALPTKLAKEICDQSDGRAEIFNEYGPTEATIGCVVHRFEPERDFDAFVSIGLPITNTEVLLLDENLRLVPEGETGEIFLSGECLALGYLARPEENVRFKSHPFRNDCRIYCTGDRARQSPNGEFEYRGRTDEQIKVRGHRVEIGEIETAIEASGFCRAFAVVQERLSSGLRLAAFVTWRNDACDEKLRMALAKSLPSHMLPFRIVGLAQMPLNGNGKVDKSLLPVELATSSLQNDDEQAVDIMESDLASIVLRLPGCSFETIPYDKSLLELGFDSLQMMMLFTLAERRFLPPSSCNLLFSTLDEFYRAPTVRNIAKHLRQLISVGNSGDHVVHNLKEETSSRP